jgi:hypothetical protein
MTIPPVHPTAPRTRYAAAALLAVAAVALLVRVLSIAEPLGIDQSLWASAVRGMSRGQLLYRDVWEQRPPGIYFVYLWAFSLLGWTAATVAWLDLLAAAAATLLLWDIARRLGGALAGAAAAALYAGLTMPAWLYGHGGFLERSVSETFIIVCVAVTAWSLVRISAGGAAPSAFLAGLAAGAALVFKPNARLYFPALLGWLYVYGRPDGVAHGGRFVRTVAIAVAASLVVPLLTFAWLWRLGLLDEARVAVVDFNRFYVGQGFSPSRYAVDFSKAIFLRLKTDPLWFAAGVGVLSAAWDAARTRRLPPLAGLAVAWGGAGALVIVVNGARLFNSYFMQVLPPLALLAAWMLTLPRQRSRARMAVALLTLAVMAGVLVKRDYAGRVWHWASLDARSLSGAIDRAAYLDQFGGYANGRGYSARANQELAEYVRAHTGPEERIFLAGISGAGVYFTADRLPAHRFLRVNFFVATDFPDERFRLDAVAADLGRARPRYIIFERLHTTADAPMGRAVDGLEQHPTVIAMLEGYRLETRIEDFTLYRRDD